MTRLAAHNALGQLSHTPNLRPGPNPMRNLSGSIHMINLQILLGTAVNTRTVLLNPRQTAGSHPLTHVLALPVRIFIGHRGIIPL